MFDALRGRNKANKMWGWRTTHKEQDDDKNISSTPPSSFLSLLTALFDISLC
jgi:hypothetical protein